MSTFLVTTSVAFLLSFCQGHNHPNTTNGGPDTGYDEGDYHMHAIGYKTIPQDFRVGGSFVWDLSGLTNDHGDNNLTYYAIGDTLMTQNKSIFVFNMNQNHESNITHFNYSNDISSILLWDPQIDGDYSLYNSLTESIVYFEDMYNNNMGYFIITTEGSRSNNNITDTNIWLYGINGSWIGNFTYNEEIFGLMNNSGFQDGEGIKSMAITPDYNYVMWMPSDTLIQDYYCKDKGCVRLVLNEMDYSGDTPSWNEVAQFRYDTRYPNATVVDITVVDNNLSRVLVLEKLDNNDDTYNTRAYHIDLSNMYMYPYWDISNCTSLSPYSNCENWNITLNSTLTSNFAYDINKTIPGITDIHVDAISFTGNGIGCGDNYYFMLGASDNQEIEDTYIIFFCFHPFSSHSGHGDGHGGGNSTHHMGNSTHHTGGNSTHHTGGNSTHHTDGNHTHHMHTTDSSDDSGGHGHHHHSSTMSMSMSTTNDDVESEEDNSQFKKLDIFVNCLCLIMFAKFLTW